MRTSFNPKTAHADSNAMGAVGKRRRVMGISTQRRRGLVLFFSSMTAAFVSVREVAQDRPDVAEVLVGVLIAGGIFGLALAYGVFASRRRSRDHRTQ